MHLLKRPAPAESFIDSCADHVKLLPGRYFGPHRGFNDHIHSPALPEEKEERQARMMTVADALRLASQYFDAGQFAAAEHLFRYVLELDPQHAEALRALGHIPRSANGHAQLAKSLASQGRLEEAVVLLRRAVQLAPVDATTLTNLGVALGMQGRHEEAIASLQSALELNPADARAHNNLGEALRRQGRLEEASAALRQAIRLRPDLSEAHNNLGLALFELGRIEQALACYRAALSLNPPYAEAHNNLGNALRDQDNLDGAVASLRRALQIQPHFPEALNNLGLVLRDQNRLVEARACTEQALHMLPTLADAHCALGELQQEWGDLDAADRCFREALHHESGHAVALANLAMMQRGKLSEGDLHLLQQRLAEPSLNSNQRVGLLFGLAQVLDGRGRYGEAAASLETANALEGTRWRLRGRACDPAEHTRFMDLLEQTFTPQFFDRTRPWGVDSERPVFIFGLPRSGTSLVEQILASHSQVYGGGELPFAAKDFQALAEQDQPLAQPAAQHQQAIAALQRLDRTAVQHLAQRHLRWLLELNPTAARVTSKMPANWRYLGLLAVLFPRAKFIHCRRDLRDVAVSCWMTRFQHLNWTCDQEHIASRFHDYRRLMAHWRSGLPVPMLEIDYEATVADLEGTVRRLLGWLGLECEPACLNFHETRRPIRTASAAQVRHPLYRTSVGRWRNYAAALDRLFQRLQSIP
jgi:tetratricopeptide (TPR) repeat protein